MISHEDMIAVRSIYREAFERKYGKNEWAVALIESMAKLYPETFPNGSLDASGYRKLVLDCPVMGGAQHAQ